jgi:hypothetical protein
MYLPVTGPSFGQLAKLVALDGEVVGAVVSDGLHREPPCWEAVEIRHLIKGTDISASKVLESRCVKR